MALISLPDSLLFVRHLVGFDRLDAGLRAGTLVAPGSVSANQQLQTLAAQIASTENLVRQFTQQANSLQRQNLSEQRAVALAQAEQQRAYLQQLRNERQRLEQEAKLQMRVAQEREILRRCVDLFARAQDYRRQGQWLDFIFTTLAAMRICRQVGTDLEEAATRLQLSELYGKLHEKLTETLELAGARHELASAYSALLTPVTSLQREVAQTAAAADGARARLATLNKAPSDPDSAGLLAEVDDVAKQIGIAADEAARLRQVVTQEVDVSSLGELLYLATPGCSEVLGATLRSPWRSWLETAESQLGTRLDHLWRDVAGASAALEQVQTQLTSSAAQAKQLRQSVAWASAATSLLQQAASYRNRYRELATLVGSIDPARLHADNLVDACFTLDQAAHGLSDDFVGYQKLLDDSALAARGQLSPGVIQGIRTLPGAEQDISIQDLQSAFQLPVDIKDLKREATRKSAACRQRLLTLAGNLDNSTQLREHFAARLGEARVSEIEQRLGAQSPGLAGRVRIMLGGAGAREAEGRRQLMLALADEAMPLTRGVGARAAPSVARYGLVLGGLALVLVVGLWLQAGAASRQGRPSIVATMTVPAAAGVPAVTPRATATQPRLVATSSPAATATATAPSSTPTRIPTRTTVASRTRAPTSTRAATPTSAPTRTAAPRPTATPSVPPSATVPAPPSATPTETVPPSATLPPTPVPTDTATPDQALTATAAAYGHLTAPKGNGFYTVGVEILPGKWHSTGRGDSCYWARLDSAQNILGNHFGSAGGTVTIRPDDYEVEFDGCGTWVYVENQPIVLEPTASDPKDNGFYTVGVEIAPGLWQSTGTGDSCYWARLDGFQEIIDNHFGLAGGTVNVQGSDYEVQFDGCGTWVYLGP
jgi:hypothetical protein